MTKLILYGFGLLMLIAAACGTESEPIQFGTDACAHCKMTIMDPKFGAEIVTAKGKVFKFDDVNCMVQYVASGSLATQDIAHEWVIDFSRPKTLIAAGSAHYILSDKIKSPMASGVAAFSVAAERDAALAEWGGEALQWGDVNKMFSK